MKKTIKLLALILTFVMAFTFVGCKRNPVTVDEDSVIITANFKDYDIEGKTLLEFMEILKGEEKLTYEISEGMITSVNGKANTLNTFWMIYTDDESNYNFDWGTLEYKGKTYGSAIYGASELPLTDGATYILVYQTFAI
jgi:hypothetical protein